MITTKLSNCCNKRVRSYSGHHDYFCTFCGCRCDAHPNPLFDNGFVHWLMWVVLCTTGAFCVLYLVGQAALFLISAL